MIQVNNIDVPMARFRRCITSLLKYRRIRQSQSLVRTELEKQH